MISMNVTTKCVVYNEHILEHLVTPILAPECMAAIFKLATIYKIHKFEVTS